MRPEGVTRLLMVTLGRREGKGKYRYAQGSEYTGDWLADKMHGQGVYLYANGTPLTLDSKPETQNPKPYTLNHKPQTPNPKPYANSKFSVVCADPFVCISVEGLHAAALWVVKVGGDDGELRPWLYIYEGRRGRWGTPTMALHK